MDSKLLKGLVKELAGDGALAWAWKKDGRLVVIGARGEKRCFDSQACQQVLKKLACDGKEMSPAKEKKELGKEDKRND